MRGSRYPIIRIYMIKIIKKSEMQGFAFHSFKFIYLFY